MKYSNCLIEALKAKIKDPKNVKILILPGKIFGEHLHVMWREGDTVKHAYKSSKDKCKWNRFFYKVKYKTNSFESFEAYILDYIKNQDFKTQIKYAKKFDLKSINMNGVLGWDIAGNIVDSEILKTYSVTEGMIDSVKAKENFEYLNRVLKGRLIIKAILNKKIKTVTFDELLKLNSNTLYKYVTPFDKEEYCEIFGYLKSKKIALDLNE